MYAGLQEDMNRAKIELRAARKAQAEAKRAMMAYTKAQVAGNNLAAKAQMKIYPLREQLTAIVGTEEFEQLPLLLKTQLRIAYNEIKAINSIASDCLYGTRVDAEFDNKFLNAAVTNAQETMKDLKKARL